MNFRDLQRYFSGGFTEAEKIYLLSLYQNPKGREILAIAFEEGWKESANRKGPIWDSDFCFIQILKKITSDRETIN